MGRSAGRGCNIVLLIQNQAQTPFWKLVPWLMRLRPGIVSPSAADIRPKLEVTTNFRGSFHNIRIMPLLRIVSAFEKKGLRKNIVKLHEIS